jgi:hypothetical protein
LQLDAQPIPERQVELATVKSRTKKRFIPPIPMEWFLRACILPGKTPVVAMIVWYLFRLKGSKAFVLTQVSLRPFGVTRQAKYRALTSLESAGLVAVSRRSRRNPEVTVLAADSKVRQSPVTYPPAHQVDTLPNHTGD